MKNCILIIMLVMINSCKTQESVFKECDFEVLKEINSENEVEQKDMRVLLQSLNNHCIEHNVEYAECVNEILFSLLENNTEILLKELELYKNKETFSLFLQQIEHPLSDTIPLESIKQNLQLYKIKYTIVEDVINALDE